MPAKDFQARGFVIATQRSGQEGYSLEVGSEIVSESESKRRLAAMSVEDRCSSIAVPIHATVTDSEVYAALIRSYQAKIDELQKLG